MKTVEITFRLRVPKSVSDTGLMLLFADALSSFVGTRRDAEAYVKKHYSWLGSKLDIEKKTEDVLRRVNLVDFIQAGGLNPTVREVDNN